jgi:hypothetical protein
MSLSTAIILNAIFDLGVVLTAGATMLVPFALDCRGDDVDVPPLASPLPDDLAA